MSNKNSKIGHSKETPIEVKKYPHDSQEKYNKFIKIVSIKNYLQNKHKTDQFGRLRFEGVKKSYLKLENIGKLENREEKDTTSYPQGLRLILSRGIYVRLSSLDQKHWKKYWSHKAKKFKENNELVGELHTINGGILSFGLPIDEISLKYPLIKKENTEMIEEVNNDYELGHRYYSIKIRKPKKCKELDALMGEVEKFSQDYYKLASKINKEHKKEFEAKTKKWDSIISF